MLVSHKWLQRFFDDPLPLAEEIAEKLTFGAFEIESIIRHPMSKSKSDTVIDVKVLPDRACYALSHRGIAREIATLCDLAMKDPLREPHPALSPKTDAIKLSVDMERCPFYAAALIKNVKIGPSPAWLRERVEALGQKSINNVVDATNFVMFDLGAPLHVFDAKALSGTIGVRAAKDGEKITALGGQEKELTSEMTVITDADKNLPIAIAGVKGGTHAELSPHTTDIIIEAAKFDPLRTRKTAAALNLKTDASKRFENNMAIELPAYGMDAVVKLILEIAGGELIGYAATELPYKLSYKLGIATADVNRLLGTNLSESDVTTRLSRLGLTFECVENPIARVLELASTLVGAKYKIPSAIQYDAPHAFSCSSFINYLFVQAGIALPSITVDQYLWGDPVSKEKLLPGDIVFLNSKTGKEWYVSQEFAKGTTVSEGINHNGIYMGDGKVIQASQTRGEVVIEDLREFESKGLVGYRRVTSALPRLIVAVPFERLDLRIPQDLVEEIGRVYGYANIKAEPLPSVTSAESDPHWCGAEIVRKALGELSCTEVYTYTLRNDGEVELANALAADKSTLRRSLAPGIVEALDKNEYNAPLLGIDTVKIFEIGHVFTKDAETLHVCVGARPLAQKKRAERASAMLLDAKVAIEKALGIKAVDYRIHDETLEFELDTQILDIRCPMLPLIASDVQYKPLSPYPFVLRDIALWVSEGTSPDEVHTLIRDKGGTLLVRLDQFDAFTKESHTSYAFHMVFQSPEKTLSDSEVNSVMDAIHKALQTKGWEVR